jgi:DNA-binding LacI/PurR family transcriptional regulator
LSESRARSIASKTGRLHLIVSTRKLFHDALSESKRSKPILVYIAEARYLPAVGKSLKTWDVEGIRIERQPGFPRMGDISKLKPVTPQHGRPLYQRVRDALRDAVDRGIFTPGEQMPSTKELSQKLDVSLMTTHRALQELVTSGVLQRSQGRGTFVHDRYFERKRALLTDTRIGLFFHREATLADDYHGQVLEGVRQAADAMCADLMLLRFGEDIRNECDGYLYVNPYATARSDVPATAVVAVAAAAAGDPHSRRPSLVIGGRMPGEPSRSIDIDNVDLARQAVAHLESLGHERIGYVGSGDHLGNSRDRWNGFVGALGRREPALAFKGASCRLSEAERRTLRDLLGRAPRPTAIFAAGYYFALDVYSAAASAGLRVPDDLSVVGVDDPMSAEYLSPPLTTLRQPLVELGRAAMAALMTRIDGAGGDDDVIDDAAPSNLTAELIVRRSTAKPPADERRGRRKQ